MDSTVDYGVEFGKATAAFRRAALAVPASVRRFVKELGSFAGLLGVVSLGFLALFILHQLTLWASVRPAVAFETAKFVVYGLEVGWNSAARILNAGLEIVDTLLPVWNSASNYVVEPAIYVILDVISLVFTGDSYAGLITEEAVPYAGFSCTSDAGSAAWCGAFDEYEARLRDADQGAAFAKDSIVLGVKTARRLQEATGDTIVPVIDLGAVLPGLVGLSSAVITLIGSVADGACTRSTPCSARWPCCCGTRSSS